MNDSKLPNTAKKLSVKQSLVMISLSVFLISGTCLLILTYFQQVRERQKQDPSYEIVAVVQTSPDREGLKTGYLTELLDLSIDHPRNLYSYDTQEAVQKLLQQSVFKEVSIRKIRPGTIHVDYSLRKPIAYIGDFTNTAIDADGTIFPFKPFFTPKKLPIIYFGSDDWDDFPTWGSTLSGQRKELAFRLLALSEKFCDTFSSLYCIDVSNAFASSDGERQIVLMLEDRLLRVVEGQTVLCTYPRILRLRQDNYEQQLGNYLNLRTYLREQNRKEPLPSQGAIQEAKSLIIDLRLSELAFFY